MARKLADLLGEFAGGDGCEKGEEGPFEIVKIERGRLSLVGDLHGKIYGAVRVPEEASSLAKVGWTISTTDPTASVPT